MNSVTIRHMGSPRLQDLGQMMRDRRIDAGLTLQQLGDRLKCHDESVACSTAHLSQVENGRSWPSEQLVDCLDREFGSGSEFRSLLRLAKVPPSSIGASYELDVHLIKPVFLGVDYGLPDLPTTDEDLAHLALASSYSASDNEQLYVFPFGVAVARKQIRFTGQHIAELAVWRAETFEDELVTDRTIDFFDAIPDAKKLHDESSYVLSTFVVEQSAWADGAQLATAIRLLSCPDVVLKAPGGDEEFFGPCKYDADDLAFEESLMLSDYPIVDGVDFGIEPLSQGYASWAGVAYYPANRRRAMPPVHLLDFEVQLQAVWCYANAILVGLTEGGKQEAVLLRRLLRQLGQVGARENHQYRRMRDALIETSRVVDVVNNAVEYLLVSVDG